MRFHWRGFPLVQAAPFLSCIEFFQLLAFPGPKPEIHTLLLKDEKNPPCSSLKYPCSEQKLHFEAIYNQWLTSLGNA
jgi:hypothetical protein